MAALKKYLREQARRTEKAPPTVFVGREPVIDSVMSFQRYWKPKEVYADTHVVLGAPGAGKTSLAGELAKRWEGRKGATSIVSPSIPKTEEDIQNICKRIALALGAMKPDEDRVIRSRGRKAAGSVKVARGEASWQTSTAPPKVASVQAIPHLPGFNPKKAESRRIAVFIDEIQNIKPDTPAAALIDDLHTQQTMPVLLVCSGLADSKAKLSEAGNTRFVEQHIHRIGLLSFDEAVKCVTKSLEKARDEYHLPAGDGAIKLWAKELAEASNQWPRHLHCYLAATWEALAEMIEPNLNEASLEAALAQGKAMRTAYYKRLIAESGVNISIIHALTRALSQAGPSGGVHKDALVGIIAEAVEGLPEPHKKAHNRTFSVEEDCLMHLLHKGIVIHDTGNVYSVPVPSFSEYVEHGVNPPESRNDIDNEPTAKP